VGGMFDAHQQDYALVSGHGWIYEIDFMDCDEAVEEGIRNPVSGFCTCLGRYSSKVSEVPEIPF
jgi:hypothetical protein